MSFSYRSLACASSALLCGVLSAQFPTSYARISVPSIPSGGIATDFDIGDINGDGHADIVVASNTGLQIWWNATGSPNAPSFPGHGNFIDATSVQIGILPSVFFLNPWSVKLVDFDGDGDLDLIVGNGNFGLEVIPLINNGSGIFTQQPAVILLTGSYDIKQFDAGDVDGDGDIDLVGAAFEFNGISSPPQTVLLLNTGTSGSFVDASATLPALPPSSQEGIALVDYDSDSDLDIVIARTPNVFYPGTTGQEVLFQNQLAQTGTMSFVDVTATVLPAINSFSSTLSAGDVNGDGFVDLLDNNNLYINSGPPAFTYSAAPAGQFPFASFTIDSCLIDIDRDCDLDAVLATLGQPVVNLNDGTGTFTTLAGAVGPATFSTTWAMGCGDVDADGDPDLIFETGALTNPVRLLPNLHRDLDAPTAVAASSAATFSYTVHHETGIGSTPIGYGLLIDVTPPAAYSAIPLLGPECGTAISGLWGLSPAAVSIASGTIPAGATTIGPIQTKPSMVGVTVRAQGAYATATSLRFGPAVETVLL